MPRPTATGLTRREALELLGMSAAAAALPGIASAQTSVTFPKGAIIRTVLKDYAPEELAGGATLFHEHLSINLSGLNPKPAATPPLPPITDDVDMITQLVNRAATEDVSCIVDGGHTDMGRKMNDLRAIAGKTKVHIVASGGFYMARTYPPDVAAKTDDQLAEDLVREARQDRHGAFGEIGENPAAGELTLDERKVFRAVGKASVRTGLPIFTHNSYGTGPAVPRDIGLQQLDILEAVGVRPEKIAIGHTCCLDDPPATIIKEIAKRGAWVGFDRVTTVQQIMADDKKVAMVMAFVEAGFANRLLLAADFTGQRTLDAGPGYARTVTVFGPLLRKAGMDEATLRMILYDNPRRFLAFVPVRG